MLLAAIKLLFTAPLMRVKHCYLLGITKGLKNEQTNTRADTRPSQVRQETTRASVGAIDRGGTRLA